MLNPGQSAIQRDLRTLFQAGSAAGLTDGDLLERFTTRESEGAEHAFAMIVERHGPMVLRVCRRVLSDPHDVDDAFQATFLVLVRRARSVRNRDSLGSWLHGVAYRVASCARSAAVRRRFHERKGSPASDATGSNHDDGLGAVLHEELTRLPDRLRAPVVLCYLQGRTYDEAAAHLHLPVGTLKSRLSRARDRLQTRLSSRGFAPAALAITSAFTTEAEAAGPTAALIETTARAAIQFAAKPAEMTVAISASVAVLTEGVLKGMSFTLWKSLGLAGVSVFGIVASGVAVQAQLSPTSPAAPVAEATAPATPSTPTQPAVAAAPATPSSPSQPATAAAPADDRLKAMENKLERLLNVLERRVEAVPSVPPAEPVISTLAPVHAAPSALAPVAPAAPPALAAPVPMPPAPPVARAPRNRAVARPARPRAPAQVVPDTQLETKIESLEHRLQQIQDRLDRLEKLTGHQSSEEHEEEVREAEETGDPMPEPAAPHEEAIPEPETIDPSPSTEEAPPTEPEQPPTEEPREESPAVEPDQHAALAPEPDGETYHARKSRTRIYASPSSPTEPEPTAQAGTRRASTGELSAVLPDLTKGRSSFELDDLTSESGRSTSRRLVAPTPRNDPSKSRPITRRDVQ
ncbi:RNA polymerase sigma factor [Singulisphaera sp. PoT]|uniref:RNA polymerase sigma factor n=1 Tax=Singulisphaera sp. PoT TaxID=3411797 RepID=UPI003BF47A5E